jgi:hypothetical protein
MVSQTLQPQPEGESIMTNKSQIVALYGELLATSLKLDSLLEKELRGGSFLPDSLIAQLAEEHARQYDCFFATGENGAYHFYTSEESVSANRHDAAERKWQRCIAKFHNIKKSNRGGARKTEAKPEWQKLGDAVLKLKKAEIDRLMKYIGRA